ncbi:MAG: hypothetical protein JSV44_00580 [Candidatus Zixiibacteriota bacterium]|nr:MAG: hypothetical protein JSV44_00580 [candidate division Zixibacteria bacterium]
MSHPITWTQSRVSAILPYSLYLLIMVLLVVRFVSLDIDPPDFLARYTTSHLTDPYQYTSHARNAVLFDEWNPFGYHRWDVFKYSAVSGLSYLLFTLFGVSRITANVSGLLLNIGGIIFFILGLRIFRPIRECLITGAILCINSVLFFYGRLPFLENGLIFLSGATFFFFLHYHDTYTGNIVAGFLIAAAALCGKLFGAVFVVPVIATHIFLTGGRSIRKITSMFAGFFVGGILLIFVFYEGKIPLMLTYYQEQAVGLYGIPESLQSLKAFLFQFFAFGARLGFLKLTPFISLLALMSLGILLLTVEKRKPNQLPIVPIIFAAVWLISASFGLMALNYRPLRYSLFLYFPISALAGYLIYAVFSRRISLSGQFFWISIPIFFFSTWFLTVQVITGYMPVLRAVISGSLSFLATALFAASVTGVVFILLRGGTRHISQYIAVPIIALLIIGALMKQTSCIYEGLSRPGNYLKRYNHDISQLIEKNAVLAGPFAPALTIDNNLRGIIFYFSLPETEPDLFLRFPISHVVSDLSNWRYAQRDYPQYSALPSTATLPIQNVTINLIGVNHVDIMPTSFERAALAYANRQYDSSLAFYRQFCDSHPGNLTAQLSLLEILLTTGRYKEFEQQFDFLVKHHPYDFRIHMIGHRGYSFLHRQTGKWSYRERAENHKKTAIEINPFAGALK